MELTCVEVTSSMTQNDWRMLSDVRGCMWWREQAEARESTLEEAGMISGEEEILGGMS